VTTFSSDSPAATAALATAIAPLLEPGDVVLMRGELGAGKTTLTRALAAALGIDGRVTSPTFALAQRYEGPVPLLHIDAYRLPGADDEELGLLFADHADAVTVVEWPDQLGPGLPAARLEIELSHAGPERRLVALESADPATRARLDTLVADLRTRHLDPEP
jgi:tRNA threonylcarbamoyladenosine biosynthesis protein TsaE